MSVAEWRVEVRVQLTAQVGDRQLDELMSSAATGDFGDARDVDVARDPIGLVLFGHVLGPDSPADELVRFWRRAQKWLDAGGVDGSVAEGRVCTDELFADEALRPDTAELVGPGEVAELLGVSRQRVHQLSAQHPDFPAPYARLGIGSVWTRPAVEAFERRWSRKPGRPVHATG